MDGFTLIDGVLSGYGIDACCKVLASADASDSIGIRCEFMVVEAPRNLPDGIYTVSFNRHTAMTRKLDGMWLSEVVR